MKKSWACCVNVRKCYKTHCDEGAVVAQWQLPYLYLDFGAALGHPHQTRARRHKIRLLVEPAVWSGGGLLEQLAAQDDQLSMPLPSDMKFSLLNQFVKNLHLLNLRLLRT